MTLTEAILAVRPGAVWSLSGDTLDKLDWQDKVQAPPSQAEIDAIMTNGPDQRRAALRADAGVQDLITRLQSASVAQIDAWITANVTTLPQARTLLATIVKLLAIR